MICDNICMNICYMFVLSARFFKSPSLCCPARSYCNVSVCFSYIHILRAATVLSTLNTADRTNKQETVGCWLSRNRRVELHQLHWRAHSARKNAAVESEGGPFLPSLRGHISWDPKVTSQFWPPVSLRYLVMMIFPPPLVHYGLGL